MSRIGPHHHVNADPGHPGGIVLATGAHTVYLDGPTTTALRKWLTANAGESETAAGVGAGSERGAIVAGLRAILARDDIGHNPIGVQYGAGFIAGLTYAANAIERGDYQPVPS